MINLVNKSTTMDNNTNSMSFIMKESEITLSEFLGVDKSKFKKKEKKEEEKERLNIFELFNIEKDKK